MQNTGINTHSGESSAAVACTRDATTDGSKQLLLAAWPLLFLAVVVLAWFWPITVLNRQPVGGDVSRTYFPLMCYYGAALAQGRVPLWNERWGFGVPALAESQMGVFYPPHLVSFRLLSPANAYRLNILFHFVLSAWVAYACARGFGLSRPAACLAGIVFAGQGFFIVQLSRQWSYAGGCWLPLAVLLTWRWLERGSTGPGMRCGCLLGLALILGIQLLAGHFQIAFFTHVTMLLLCLGSVLWCQGRRWQVARRSLPVLLTQAGALLLAAVQMVPTSELAVRSDPRTRGWQELGRFANPPPHLISYVAPTLLHRHPMWAPIAWEPWHTSSDESLNYMGIIPLCLAFGAIGVARREPVVRLWCLLAAVSLALSFGPYLPGFRWLVRLPGFNWSAAPARWSIVTGLFLGLLAGRGLDALASGVWRRWSCRFVAAALTMLTLSCGLAVAVSAGGLRPWLDRTWNWLNPWSEPAWSNQFDEPPDNALRLRLLDYGYQPRELNTTPAKQIGRMLRDGLTLPAINLALLGLLAMVDMTRRCGAGLLVLLPSLDLGITAHVLRGLEFQTNRALIEQSPVLARLAAEAPCRVVGPMRNLAMVVGSAPFPDVPIPGVSRFWDLGPHLASSAVLFDEDDVQFIRFTDIRLLVQPSKQKPPDGLGLRLISELDDRWLTRLAAGRRYVDWSGPSATRWTIWEPSAAGSRAWTFPLPTADTPGTDPRQLRFLPTRRRGLLDEYAQRPESVVVDGERVEMTGTTDTPAVLVVSDAHYPGWEAHLDQAGKRRPVPIVEAFGGWRAVELPEAGPYRVTMHYRPASFRVGTWISLGTGAFWSVLFVMDWCCRRQPRTLEVTGHADAIKWAARRAWAVQTFAHLSLSQANTQPRLSGARR